MKTYKAGLFGIMMIFSSASYSSGLAIVLRDFAGSSQPTDYNVLGFCNSVGGFIDLHLCPYPDGLFINNGALPPTDVSASFDLSKNFTLLNAPASTAFDQYVTFTEQEHPLYDTNGDLLWDDYLRVEFDPSLNLPNPKVIVSLVSNYDGKQTLPVNSKRVGSFKNYVNEVFLVSGLLYENLPVEATPICSNGQGDGTNPPECIGRLYTPTVPSFSVTPQVMSNIGLVGSYRPELFVSPTTISGIPLVGDKDEFHSGDVADKPNRSKNVQELLKWIGALPDQDPGVDLDVGGSNRPVGFTHYFSLPQGARITAATIKFRAKSVGDSFYNDSIIFEPIASLPEGERNKPQLSSYSKSFKDEPNCANFPGTCYPDASRDDFYPIITLKDLNKGKEPKNGESVDFTINLAKVPLRTKSLPVQPGGSWSSKPDEYRDLLGLLTDGQFDIIIGDDSQIDYSQLDITYILSDAPDGDLTGDGKVDKNDLNLLMAAVGTNSYGANDPRDINKDGKISVLDVRKLVLSVHKQAAKN